MNFLFILAVMTVMAVVSVILPLPGFNFFVPLFSTFMTTQEAITFASMYFLFNYIAIWYVFRHHIRKDIAWALIPGSVLGAILGGLLTSSLNELLLTWVVFGFVIYFLIAKVRIMRGSAAKETDKKKRVKGGAVIIGAVAGFLQGGGLGGGQVRNGYLYAKNLNLQQSRGTTAVVGALILAVAVTTRAVHGTFIVKHAWLYLALIPIAFTSALLGRYITTKLNAKTQNVIIVVLMFISIILLVVKLINLTT